VRGIELRLEIARVRLVKGGLSLYRDRKSFCWPSGLALRGVRFGTLVLVMAPDTPSRLREALHSAAARQD
jgi:hypothetical protein